MTQHVWFTADLHFRHRKIMKFHPKRNQTEWGWNDDEAIEAHDQMLVENWNAVVGRKDHVYVLGDVCFGYQEDADLWIPRLNGYKHLIWGNHDPTRVQRMPVWVSVEQIKEVKVGEHRFVCCHYPMVSWNKMNKGWYHLHGHSHGGLLRSGEFRRQPARMDVGIDCHPNLRPFHVDEVLANLGEAELRADANHSVRRDRVPTGDDPTGSPDTSARWNPRNT